MTNPGPAHALASRDPAPDPANDDERPVAIAASTETAANDNPTSSDLPACLLVTEEEVRLLQRYLGQQILGLFS